AQALPPARRHMPARTAAAVLLLAGGIAGITWWLARGRRPLELPVTRLSMALAPAERLALESMPSFAVSPDGTRIVIATERQGSSQLHLRRLDRFDHAPIPGTEGATGPFFSPDGEWVGFFAAGKLKKAPLAGGPPVILCEALNPRGGAWAS